MCSLAEEIIAGHMATNLSLDPDLI